MKWLKRILVVGGILIIVGGGLMLIPAVRERVVWHANNLYIQAKYALFPPEKEVFVPQAQVTINPPATTTPLPPTETPLPSATPQPDQPTSTSTPTRAPLPEKASVDGVKYIDQHGLYNYCAPANLAMELSKWGWSGDRTDIGNVVKPYEKDKNVMPYELVDFVHQYTSLGVVQRSGGNAEILKGFIAAGYPVLVEKGAYIQDLTGKVSWMGHYAVVTGYDDATQKYMTQDSYYQADYPVDYSTLMEGWRAFNFVFIVVYPAEREAEVLQLLGPLADEANAFRAAAEIASKEAYSTSGNDQFFAWFNRGTSLVNLQDYAGAAEAYDQSFQLYAKLPEDKRPWRMVWYQTGPYFAYYYSGRYADVENLASQTIDSASEPYLEESWYWRGMARVQMGKRQEGIDDLKQSLVYHPGFAPSLAALQSLGVAP